MSGFVKRIGLLVGMDKADRFTEESVYERVRYRLDFYDVVHNQQEDQEAYIRAQKESRDDGKHKSIEMKYTDICNEKTEMEKTIKELQKLTEELKAKNKHLTQEKMGIETKLKLIESRTCKIEKENLESRIEDKPKKMPPCKPQEVHTELEDINKNSDEKEKMIADLEETVDRTRAELKRSEHEYEQCLLKLENEQDKVESINAKSDEKKKMIADLEDTVDKMRAELKHSEHEYEQCLLKLKNEQDKVESMNAKSNDKEKVIADLEEIINSTKAELEDSNLKYQQHIQKLKSQVASASGRRYEELMANYIELKNKLDEYNESWGKQMSQAASGDEKGRENLSSKWSPMRVADAYKVLTNKYSVADILEKQSLVDSTDVDYTAAEISFYIFQTASEIFQELHEACHSFLRGFFFNPILYVAGNEEINPDMQSTPLGKETSKEQERRKNDENHILQLLDCHYKDSWEIDTSMVKRIVVERMIRTYQEEKLEFVSILSRLLECHEMGLFLESLCELCWIMALIHPPMRFSYMGIGKRFDEERQIADISSECNPKNPEAVVKYYIIPMLMHVDHVYNRGLVVVGPHKAAIQKKH